MRRHTTDPIRLVTAVAAVAPIRAHRRSVGAWLAFATIRQFYQKQLQGKFARLVEGSDKQ